MTLKEYLSRLPLTDRITFVIEAWSAVTFGVFSGLALPLISIVARRIGMSPAGITAMVTMQFIGALFGIFFGHLADTRAKMPLAVWPPLIGRASLVFLAFARTPGFYLVVVSLFNLLSNVSSPAYSSIMRTNYSDANRGRLMGNIRIVIVAVSTLCSALAGILLARNENCVHWLFAIAAVFGVASSIIFGRIKVRRGPGIPQGTGTVSFARSARIVRRNVPFMLFMGIMFLCAFGDKFAIPLEPIWLVDTLKVGYGDASFLLGSVVSLVSIVGYFVWARALKRFNSFAVLSCVVFVYAARFASLAVARSSSQLLPMCIFSGLSNAGWDLVPLFCMIALAEPANFSLYIGFNTTLYGVRGLMGPWIGTALYTSGALSIRSIFWMITAIIACGGGVMLAFSFRLRCRAPVKGGVSYDGSAGG